MTDQLDLDQIETRAAAATPGPWKIENDYCDCSDYGCSHPPFAVAFGPFTSFENTTDRHHADAEFAAAARTDVPAMAAVIRRLRAELADQADADTVAARAAKVITTMGAEIRALKQERNRYRNAWHNARARAVDARDDVEFTEAAAERASRP